MPNSPDPLDVASLRASGAVPHWFGLGFVQLKLDETTRVHFWSPSHGQITPEDELHDHRYGFVSKVVAGSMVHEVWNWEPRDDGDHEMTEVSCKPGAPSDPAVIGRGQIRLAGRYRLAVGSDYMFPANCFHRGRTEGGAITLLARGPVERDTARVLRPLGHASVCPFSAPKDEDECWAIMEALVRDLRPTGRLVGGSASDALR